MEQQFIKGYENLYKISKDGIIFSCIYQKEMSNMISKDGYMKISLSGNGLRVKRTIHRLLALQYIPNPDNLPEVDHIDRNPLNNSLDNLRWVNKITQNGNRACCLKFKTEEELEERHYKIKERAKDWATKNRRSKGIEERKLKTGVELEEQIKARNCRRNERLANKTPQEKEEHLKHRRESRKPQTEEQKVKARERAQKQRDSKKL